MIIAQPGDRIGITNPELVGWYGNTYTVIPPKMLSPRDDGKWLEHVFVSHRYGWTMIRHEDYMVLPRPQDRSVDLYITPEMYRDMYRWANDEKVKQIAATIGQSSYPKDCPDCKGKGKITMLHFDVDCDCVKNTIMAKKEEGCQDCSSQYCFCDGVCKGHYGPCDRCDDLCCFGCIVDGYCNSCFSKLQGGVN